MATRLGNKEIKLVSTNAELGEMLAELNNTRPNVISVDAEGWDISRDGTLSLLALSWNEGLIYVIDVQVRMIKDFGIFIIPYIDLSRFKRFSGRVEKYDACIKSNFTSGVRLTFLQPNRKYSLEL